MISVIVERAPADKQGDDIVDALITANNVALERGRNEIDSNFTNRESVSSTGPCQGYMRQGRLIEISDSEQLAWRGIIRTVAINVTAGIGSYERMINLTIERESQ